MKIEIAMVLCCLSLLNACQQPQMPSESLSVQLLHDEWTYQEVDGEHSGAATVPGTIHTDLLNNGQIEDPFYRTNERDLQWIDKKDWVYRTRFFIDDKVFEKERVAIHFNGLDTYADVFLNGVLILEACNMHRQWTVDIKKNIKKGENDLEVYLHSPVKKGLALYEASPYLYPASNDQSENGGLQDKKISVFTRKAGYHYGWDWGPRFVTSGIWRSVELRSWNDLNIESVYIKQPIVTKERAELEAVVNIDSEQQREARISVFNRNDSVEEASVTVHLRKGLNAFSIPFEVISPKLWWSNGLGAPHRYIFEVQVRMQQEVLATKSISTGLRSIKLVREVDGKGASFLFELNGVRIFAKGANYIPNDSFLPRVTRADYERVVADAVNAHMNMLRVWGGGVYEDNYFYELCDRNGIMVWQDFMFACSMYPGDEAMLNNIKQEAVDNVKRLRNHPSIVLWCGNNEINVAWHFFGKGGWGWKERYSKAQQNEIQKAYTDIFHEVLPQVVDSLTDRVDYWPSSPQAGYEPQMHASDDATSGDMHYWGVWHALHPFEDFDRYKARFMSEYGFQSFPDFETVQRYTTPDDYGIESEVMSAHQRSGIGNLRIKEYMSWYYKVPVDFQQFLYMSQVLQAYGIRMAIEAHRRAMPYCMGSLYWQINDCWPVASWSSTDYYHKWKAVHYAVRESFDPILISAVNRGTDVDVFVVSDLLEDKKAVLQMQVLDFHGRVICEDSNDIVINKNSSTLVQTLSVSQMPRFDKRASVMVLQIVENGQVSKTKYHYFANPKELKLLSPHIDIKVVEAQQDTYLHISSDVVVRDLYLYGEGGGLLLEDNYFDLLPGKVKVVKVLKSIKPFSSGKVNYRYISC